MITLLLYFAYTILKGIFFLTLAWQNTKYSLVI